MSRGGLPPAQFDVAAIRCESVMVPMRDGTRLATDLYLPPELPAPVVALRTPYNRAQDAAVAALLAYARRGYVVLSQDCRGTGRSEPDHWDYYMYESEDSYDCVEWICRQPWFGGFLGSIGRSYGGQTQWGMALHRAMSTLVPSVSGLGIAFNTARLYMYLNAYARVVGKGAQKVAASTDAMERLLEQETLAGGYFNEPLDPPLAPALIAQFPPLKTQAPAEARRWLWEHYCRLSSAERAAFVRQALGVTDVTSVDVEALPSIFGHRIAHDAHTIPHPRPSELCRRIQAPPLLWTGWYDWCLNDAFATWEMLRRDGQPEVARRARLVITPHAHSRPGYHEGVERHLELMRTPDLMSQVGVVLRWFETVREGKTDTWPTVIYYLMGANEWHEASDWPVPEAASTAFYLGENGTLTHDPPTGPTMADRYIYDPTDPTPTIGGSILSNLYPPGSVDVSAVQRRPDVLVYTSPTLERDLDVVGPVRMVLYASSSAVDTDFVARLSDVFPDGRAIQIQSGILRARYRDLLGEPELLEPGGVYGFEIDLWHTANRFKAGHRLRVDLSSADFPHFDRNSNRGGEPGPPIPARQTIYRDPDHPSHLVVSVLARPKSVERR